MAMYCGTLHTEVYSLIESPFLHGTEAGQDYEICPTSGRFALHLSRNILIKALEQKDELLIFPFYRKTHALNLVTFPVMTGLNVFN